MTELTVLLTVFCCMVLSGFCSGIETGGYSISRVHLHYYARSGKRRARLLEQTLNRPQAFVFTVLVCNNVVNYLASKTVTGFFSDRIVGWNPGIAATLVLTPLLFVFSELFPKNLFRHHAFRLMIRSAYLIRAAVWLAAPITWPLQQGFMKLARHEGANPLEQAVRLSAQRVQLFFAEGIREGSLSLHQNRMMQKVIAMRQIPVESVLTPLRGLPVIPVDAELEEFRRALAEGGTTRCAVCRGRRNYLIGTLHLFDVLNAPAGEPFSVRQLMKKTLRIPTGTSLQKAYDRMRETGRLSAVVVDERDRAVGVLRRDDIARYIAAG